MKSICAIKRIIGPTALLILLGSGCRTIGPGTVTRDRFEYGDAIGDSWKNQTLLNMVKLRYADMPVFLDVASVINQYTLEGVISVNAPFYQGSSAVSIGGGSAHYADKPTISYVPMTGEKFAKSLLTPVTPATIIAMVQAGWPVDFIFQTCTSGINGINNRANGGARAKEDPRFRQLLQAMRRIQLSGGIGMRVEHRKEGESSVMFFRGNADEAVLADAKQVRELLGLDPETREFLIVFGAVAQSNKEIAILSRSMIEIMIEFAQTIDVPEADVTQNRVRPTAVVATGAEDNMTATLHVRSTSGSKRPPDASVAVHYREHWFWIDDRDFNSKRTFLFVMFLFSMVDNGGGQGGPILTIPAG